MASGIFFIIGCQANTWTNADLTIKLSETNFSEIWT